MDPADILEAAADALWMYGRCTGSGQRADGSMCVLGAIQYVQGNDPTLCLAHGYFDPVRVELERRLGERFGVPPLVAASTGDRYPAWIWNDRHLHAEDDAEVIDTLRMVAKDLRNEAES